MRSWSNICRKKSNGLAVSGRDFVGPTSSVKGYLGQYTITVGVSLLGNLIGADPFFLLLVAVLVVEMSSTAGEVAELSGSPCPLSLWLVPYVSLFPSLYDLSLSLHYQEE